MPMQHLAERNPIQQSELAHLLFATGQTTGFVLIKLEKNQWVTRQRGLAHNQFAVSITDQGLSVLTAAQEHLTALEILIDGDSDGDALRPVLTSIIQRAAIGASKAKDTGVSIPAPERSAAH